MTKDSFLRDGLDLEGPMPVRSVRLPEKLWQKLEAARTASKAGRRGQRVGLSSVIRALLERALEDPTPLDFDARVFRPDRLRRQKPAKIDEEQGKVKALDLYQRVHSVLDAFQMRPATFARTLGGDMQTAQVFYSRAELPSIETAAFVARVEAWLVEYEVAEKE